MPLLPVSVATRSYVDDDVDDGIRYHYDEVIVDGDGFQGEIGFCPEDQPVEGRYCAASAAFQVDGNDVSFQFQPLDIRFVDRLLAVMSVMRDEILKREPLNAGG